MIRRLVSGGQTGADRAALDVALQRGLETGGWVPRGRRAEDGRIPDRYVGLRETASRGYAERTARNVRDADATLVIHFGAPSGGTALTLRAARAEGRPWLAVDLEATPFPSAVAAVREWLERVRPAVLNVAGPRASQEPRVAAAVAELLHAVLD